ncbi:MAG: hypothetical protein ACI9C4_000608 [Paraglaciecola sp.]|jgi:hypothetical protein
MMKSNLRWVGLLIVLWLGFQLAFGAGHRLQDKINTNNFIASIEKRVALDLPRLRLANLRFKTVADNPAVQKYIFHLNSALTSLSSNIYIQSIQGIIVASPVKGEQLSRILHTADQQIELKLTRIPPTLVKKLNFYAPFMALLIVFLSYIRATTVKAHIALKNETVAPKPGKLVINLRDKSIQYGTDNTVIALPNKPFCFYAALVDYCLQNDTACLRHNNDVPEELLQIANKYFYRLIELGHTKRKRPDFGANLDKTLSEIRSVLDEVFQHHVQAKELFYPPKAQGEGSRSKMHNYALANNEPQRVEFIGQ